MSTPARAPILIVEDERIVAKNLQQTLNGWGYDAYAIAASADEAIAHATATCPSLVLMDIRIKGERDGVAAAAVLKERFHPSLIYMTAHVDDPMVERAMKTEPDGYLVKPVKPTELNSMIKIALYRRELAALRRNEEALQVRSRALQETVRLQGEFVSRLAHELRTPLNGVIGFASLMQSGIAGPISDEHRTFMNLVLSSGRRLLKLVNNVLDLTQIEAGGAEFHAEPLDMAQMFAEAVDALLAPIREKGHEVHTVIGSTCETLVNDRAALANLLYQFLSNAVKFMPQPGAITLRVLPDGPVAIRIEVEDSGIGVDPAQADRLFLAFSRLHEERREEFQGAGLGLVLCKRIAESQGGRVGIEAAPGGGSLFYAVLPRVAGP